VSGRIPEGPEPGDVSAPRAAKAPSSEVRTAEPLLRRAPDAPGAPDAPDAPDAPGAPGEAPRQTRELRAERRPVDTAAMETLLHDVPLEVSVELGRVRMPLGELAARLAPGSVIALDKDSGALLDVRVQSRLIARAEAVAIGERCGIRILELVGGNDS
jgi:flagellar motor switch protein FliN